MEIRVVRSGEDGNALAYLDIPTPDLHVEHTASGITITGSIETLRDTLARALALSAAGEDSVLRVYDKIVTTVEGSDLHNRYFAKVDYYA